MKTKFLSIKATSWESARQLADYLPLWHFRGHADDRWQLSSSLERVSKLHDGGSCMFPESTEAGMIYELQRRAHHYLTLPPSESSNVEWLAMLQHYGCPTRMLDFTRSFYIAAFFAIETAYSDAAIWAVNSSLLNQSVDMIAGRDTSGLCLYDINKENIKLVEKYIGQENRESSIVVDVEPERLNERQSIQQGIFLFPCNAQRTFLENLLTTFSIAAGEYGHINYLVPRLRWLRQVPSHKAPRSFR